MTVVSGYPGGCYECEEEVWEEVPCDQIPSNSTTIEPPYITTTTAKPETTTTTTTTSTTTTSTTPSTTTTSSTTPASTDTTTPSNDPYQKCYCECKAGCKEFCRKVVVHPEIKDQIIQVSEVSQPVPQGRLESTHYHHRKLIPYPGYANHQTVSSQVYSNSQGVSTSVALQKPRPELPNVYTSSSSYRNPVAPSQSYGYSNNIGSDISYTNKHQTYYYSSPPSELYDLPVHFQRLYSKAVQELEGDNMMYSVPSSNSIPNTPDYGIPCNNMGPFSSPVPVSSAVSSNINIRSQPFYGTYQGYSETPHYSIWNR